MPSRELAKLCEKKSLRFEEYSKKYYNGLISSWIENIQPILMECINCQHIFYKTNPSEDQLTSMYASMNREDQENKEPNAQMINVMRNMKKITNKKKPLLLDWGAGFCLWSEAAYRTGFEVVAYEPNDFRATKSTHYELCTNSSDLKNSKFDFILCEQVLEHVKNPFSFMKEIISCMHDDTILRITVPNIHRSGNKKNMINEWPYNGKNNHILAPYQHLHGFNQSSLEHLIKRSGLKFLLNVPIIKYDFLNQIRRLIGGRITKLSTTRFYLKIL